MHRTKETTPMSMVTGPLLVCLLVLPSLLQAQVTPGQKVPSRERIRAEFFANILEGINQTRDEWMQDVERDDLEGLMVLYTPEAMLVPPGGQPIYGSEAIRAYWEENLSAIRTIQTGSSDMDASGQMAMVGGSYTLERTGTGVVGARESGGLLTVFVQTGRDWRIRAQVFGSPGGG